MSHPGKWRVTKTVEPLGLAMEQILFLTGAIEITGCGRSLLRTGLGSLRRNNREFLRISGPSARKNSRKLP